MTHAQQRREAHGTDAPREVPILRNRQRALVVVESPLDRFGPPPPALSGDDVYDRDRVYDVPPTFNSGE